METVMAKKKVSTNNTSAVVIDMTTLKDLVEVVRQLQQSVDRVYEKQANIEKMTVTLGRGVEDKIAGAINSTVRPSATALINNWASRMEALYAVALPEAKWKILAHTLFSVIPDGAMIPIRPEEAQLLEQLRAAKARVLSLPA